MIIGGGSFLVFKMIRLVSFLLFSLLHTTLPHICYTKEALLLFLTLFCFHQRLPLLISTSCSASPIVGRVIIINVLYASFRLIPMHESFVLL
jgi:hypothetical protein